MSTGETERQRQAQTDRKRMSRKVEFLDARLAELVERVERLTERVERLTNYVYGDQ